MTPSVVQKRMGQNRRPPPEAGENEYWEWAVRRSKFGMRYCGRTQIPASLPDGFVLVHNNGAACDSSLFGLRVWVQKGANGLNLVRCRCEFCGPSSPTHFKVRQTKPSAIDLPRS